MKSAGFFGQWSAVTSHDTSARVGGITTPTLLLTGDVDRLIPSGNTRALAKAIPHARVVTLDGVGHMFWVEAPEIAASAMREFLG
jgi:pimeloyl-ACP methyl ester carboxylesterase